MHLYGYNLRILS